MTTNHIKIAWRLMLRNKLNSILNISGLVLGISCFILLGSYVMRELSFDQYHQRSEDIYRVWLKEDYGEGQTFFNTSTPLIFHDFLTANIEQFEQVAQWNRTSFQVSRDDHRFNEQVAILTPGFFEMFDFNFLESSRPDPLASPSGLVLSSEYALKYFGNENPLGHTLTIVINNEPRSFVVTAVLDKIPAASGIRFDMAISSLNNRDIYGPRQLDAWFMVSPETYVLLKEDASLARVEEDVRAAVQRVLGDRVQPGEYTLGFQPLTDIHLNDEIPPSLVPVGNKAEVYVLAGIAFLVLAMAGLNFITMTLAQSTNRFREVGIRKVMGAMRHSLIRQHITESLLIVSIAMILGVLVAYAVAPWYNNLTGAGLAMKLTGWHLALFGSLTLIIAVLAGFYPGMVLAGRHTTEIFRGHIKTGSNHLFRRSIVIFQFMITAFLISGTVIMHQQMSYLQSTDLGMDYHATVAAVLPPDPSATNLVDLINQTVEKGQSAREHVAGIPGVSDLAISTHVFGTDGWTAIGFRDKNDQFREANLLVSDPSWFETFKIEMSQGRSFDPDNPADKNRGVIINETAARYFGLETAIGEQMPGNDFANHEIIGVTRDFHYSSLHENIAPLIIVQDPSIIVPGASDIMFSDSPVPKLVFRYDRAPLSALADQLENIWEAQYPDEELSFSFVEENMRNLYQRERRIQSMTMAATGLSILIACLGLLGLTILTLNGKVKEIGVRKVNGASASQIFGTLTKGVFWQLLTGFILSVPLGWILFGEWLQSFAYRIDLSPWYFVISGIAAISLALAAISYHTYRAARRNPVTALRSE